MQAKVVWASPIGWGENVKACVEKCPDKDGEENCLYTPDNSKDYPDYCYLTSATKVNLYLLLGILDR